MEDGILTTRKNEKLIRRVINKIVSPRGYKKIKANAEEFDTPAKLSRQRNDEAFIPDITGVMNGRKCYFEIAQKTEKIRQVVTKWKLLSSLATFKEGKFFLIIPKGHFAFTNRILKRHPIEVKLIRI